MKNDLWRNFINILEKPDTTKNYLNYYVAITSWIQKNRSNFPEDMLKRNRLNILLELDPNAYIVSDPGFPLETELTRFICNKPNHLDVFAMIVANKLWDMVTVRGKECPNCEGDEMRYLLTEEISAKKSRKSILECNSCGWTENLDGSVWSGEQVKIMPMTTTELENLNSD